METVISMNASDYSIDRAKAVRVSAEVLREAGVTTYPLDIRYLISAFRQIDLLTYKDLDQISKMRGTESKMAFRSVSKDGFCTRFRDVLVDFRTESMTGNKWEIYYNENSLKARLRFTIPHEMGHILLGHHQALNEDTLTGMDNNPAYVAADTEADLFSINLLAPAPAVLRLLQAHGYAFDRKEIPPWKLTNPQAPFLRYLGSDAPEAEQLVMTAFGLSQTAAHRRLNELPMELRIWRDLDADLYSYVEKLDHRAAWFCWVCHTKRRRASLYCPGCGHAWHYEYLDPGKPAKPVMSLRENGQFEFCSVCGNADLPEDAVYCPVCGCPVMNECENAFQTDGDFIRSGMEIIRGTHYCRPTDIFCGDCGVVTAFGRRYGPKENMWTKNPGSDRCRTEKTVYPAVLSAENGQLVKCPSCGSERSIRNGRYCAECMQPLENYCTSEEKAGHPCDPNDRYCRICGSPTAFQKLGLFPDWRESEQFRELKEREKKKLSRPQAPLLVIQQDGAIRKALQE